LLEKWAEFGIIPICALAAQLVPGGTSSRSPASLMDKSSTSENQILKLKLQKCGVKSN